MGMHIRTAPATLTAALKAVKSFVSDDPTRNSMTSVYVEPDGATKVRFTATNGHILCSVSIDAADISGNQPARLNPIAAETLLLQAKGAKGMTSATFEITDCAGQGAFPEYRQAIPGKAEKGKTDRIQGFNAAYLAEIAPVQKLLKGRNTILQFGETNTDPLRADIAGDLGDAVVVIMPVRF